MAFAVSGNGGSTNTAGVSPIVMSASVVSQAAGNLMVVTLAYDNINGTTGDNNTVDYVRMVQSGTTIQEFDKAVIHNAGTGSANSHSTVAIYYCILAQAFTNGTHSITASVGGEALNAKAIMIRGYTITSGNSVTFETPQTASTNGGAAPTIAYSELTNREYLFIRADAREGTVNTTGAVSTNYTIFSNVIQAGTTGGGSASNMSVQSEYRIVTGTSTTTTPNVGANADLASALVAFYEFTPATYTPNMLMMF